MATRLRKRLQVQQCSVEGQQVGAGGWAAGRKCAPRVGSTAWQAELPPQDAVNITVYISFLCNTPAMSNASQVAPRLQIFLPPVPTFCVSMAMLLSACVCVATGASVSSTGHGRALMSARCWHSWRAAKSSCSCPQPTTAASTEAPKARHGVLAVLVNPALRRGMQSCCSVQQVNLSRLCTD